MYGYVQSCVYLYASLSILEFALYVMFSYIPLTQLGVNHEETNYPDDVACIAYNDLSVHRMR
jgi:hypothetical protein